MKVTNKLGLPGPVVRAIEKDPYSNSGSDYTATSLLEPPRAAILSKDLTVDASDCIDSLEGQSLHSILERSGKELAEEGYIVEKRFFAMIAVGNKLYKISAQVDLFDPAKGLLSDYKRTSVSSAKRAPKPEHTLQLSVQAELLRRNGFHVALAEVVLFLKDHTKMKLGIDGYPKCGIMCVAVPLIGSDEINKWIVERIKAHEAAKKELPLCSPEERWSRPTFAVMKAVTDKKAIRVFESHQLAAAFIAEKGLTASIIERPGESINCSRYCPARFVCEQGKKETQVVSVKDADGFIKL